MIRNRNYYRDFAAYLRETIFLCPIGLAVTNRSSAVAGNVIVTFEFDATDVSVAGEYDRSALPSTDRMLPTPTLPRRAQRVDVARFGEICEVRAYIGTVQPRTTAWSVESFYIGARQTTHVEAKVTISANNLSVPVTGMAAISIEATSRTIEVRDITARTERK
jgi:hypothetical protein